MWPTIKKHLTKGKTLYFSHGFGITYKDQTNIIPPNDIDVILVAPKGSSIPINISERRKRFEVKKRKYIRKSGNHKRGVIRGECKILKKSKASLSRSISSLLSKKLIRKVSIIDFNNKEIGLGYNLTKSGKKLINEL